MNRRRQTSLSGRAEIRLEQRAELWNQRPEFRALPSLPEFISIACLTSRRQWTDAQRRMMRSGLKSYGVLLGIVVAMLAVIAWVGRESYGQFHARSYRDQLLVAEIADVPALIESNRDYDRWSRPLLVASVTEPDASPRVRRNVAIALLDSDPQQVDVLIEEIATSAPDELPVLVEALRGARETVANAIGPALRSEDRAARLNAASVLAMLNLTDSVELQSVVEQIAIDLTESPVTLSSYLARLKPVGSRLVPSLLKLAASEHVSERNAAAVALNEYYQPTPVELADLIELATAEQFRILTPLIERGDVATIPLLQERLQAERHTPWPDTNHERMGIAEPIRDEISKAHGVCRNGFAFAPWLPFDRVDPLGTELGKHAYRPTRLRPFMTKDGLRASVVWVRDGREWDWASPLSKDEMTAEAGRMKERGLFPCDVAGFLNAENEQRFAAVWEEPASVGEQRELYFGQPPEESNRLQALFGNRGFRAFTRQIYTANAFQELRHSMVWGFDAQHVDEFYYDVLDENIFAITSRAYDCPIDVCVTRRSGHKTDAYYGAIWVMIDRRFDRVMRFGDSLEEHSAQTRELADKGYRVASVSATEVEDGGRRVATVWIRPKTKPNSAHAFAARQANCAAALAKFGHFGDVVEKLRGDCSVALRAELVHVFSSHGCDPERRDPRVLCGRERGFSAITTDGAW